LHSIKQSIDNTKQSANCIGNAEKPKLGTDLSPLIIPLVKLESMQLWPREQVVGN